MKNLSEFRFWCQKVLPLVFDDSISYYEVLCKVSDYINDLIENGNETEATIERLKSELADVQLWIENYQPEIVDAVLAQYIAPGIYFSINDAGYFVAHRPAPWTNVKFGTTGYDMQIPCGSDYGHLVLLYGNRRVPK